MSVSIDEQYIRAHFALMADGNYDQFFARVIPTVDWTVMGSHALSGHYHSIDQFQSATAARLNPRMTAPLALQVANVVASGQQAAVELTVNGTQKSGKPFNNHYCWLVRYNEEGWIKSVRAYLDGELVNQAINDNAGP